MSIPLAHFDTALKQNYVEVSSAALGAQVVACSDDFFVSRHNLIKPTPSVSMKGQFGPHGALYDGWESRRHNPAFDWIIIRLATPITSIHYVDIDTSHFNGNEAPQSQVFGLTLPSDGSVSKWTPNNENWEEILPLVDLGPDSRHIFEVNSVGKQGNYGALMVRMIPDGGMARFRAYGLPHPPFIPKSLPVDWQSLEATNLLSPLIGGRIITCSDAQFSPPGNLLLPGRGFDMSDGWETKRSQAGRGKYGPGGNLEGQERKEWVVARLGVPGVISHVEVDTAFHPGNYPRECSIEATLTPDESLDSAEWTTIVRRTPLGAHRQHYLSLEPSIPATTVFSHIRYNIYPDGGSKRVRIFGHPLDPTSPDARSTSEELIIPALPLTPETFKEYGEVIQGFSLSTSAPKGINVNIANQGTAFKFHRLALPRHTYPLGTLSKGGLHVGAVQAKSKLDLHHPRKIKVDLLERHAHTTQAFIPMGAEEGKKQGGYVVVAALAGADGQPDLSTVRAFLASAAQGVNYGVGVWHHSLLTVGGDLNYAIVEAQTSVPDETMDLEKVKPPRQLSIQLPAFPFTSSEPPSLVKPQPNGVTSALSSLLPTSSALKPLPITPENFAPYGHIITTSPSSFHTDTEHAPDGLTVKHNRLAPVTDSYPEDAGAVTGIAVFRATPKVGLERGKVFDLRYMERHPHTSQTFIPMGKAEWKDHSEPAIPSGGQFLVIVAPDHPSIPNTPDPNKVEAFLLPAHQGLSYRAGVWHHPVLVLDETMDLACVETQVATGVVDSDERDCELVSWEGEEVFGRVLVPEV
ncbi:allantoicase [Cryptococcus sp. DSM 104548]